RPRLGEEPAELPQVALVGAHCLLRRAPLIAQVVEEALDGVGVAGILLRAHGAGKRSSAPRRVKEPRRSTRERRAAPRIPRGPSRSPPRPCFPRRRSRELRREARRARAARPPARPG